MDDELAHSHPAAKWEGRVSDLGAMALKGPGFYSASPSASGCRFIMEFFSS